MPTDFTAPNAFLQKYSLEHARSLHHAALSAIKCNFLWIALFTLGLPLSARAATQYQITNLGANIQALAINDSGVVVGNLENSGDPHAMFYSEGSWTDIGRGEAKAISNNSIIAGALTRNANPPNDLMFNKAYLYSKGSFSYPTLASNAGSNYFYDVNESGNAVGLSFYNTSSGSHAIVYEDNVITDLGVTNNWYISNATGLNEGNTVVGYYQMSENSPETAFLYSDGVVTSLGTLGGSSSNASMLNDSGVVVGTSKLAGDQVSHAFSYQNGTMVDLGSLYGLSSYAANLNNDSQIVGSFYNNSINLSYAALWVGGNALDLNTLIAPDSGWVLSHANDINDNGQIVGYGSYNGTMSSFLLTPIAIPEPGSLALILIGLLAVGGLAHRCQQRRL